MAVLKNIFGGVYPHFQYFTVFYCVFLRILSEKWIYISDNCRTFATENERQSFELFERLDGRTTDRQPTEGCYMYNIYYSPRVQCNVVKRQVISAWLGY